MKNQNVQSVGRATKGQIPELLAGVELRTVGGRVDDGDVGRQARVSVAQVEAGLVSDDHMDGAVTARRPSRKHVALHVPGLHVSGLLPPVADPVLDRAGAQQRDVERCRDVQPMDHEDFLFPVTQGEGRRRVALRTEVPEVFKITLFRRRNTRSSQVEPIVDFLIDYRYPRDRHSERPRDRKRHCR